MVESGKGRREKKVNFDCVVGVGYIGENRVIKREIVGGRKSGKIFV